GKAWVGSDQKPATGFGKTPPSSISTKLQLQKPIATGQRMRYGNSSKAVTAPAAGLDAQYQPSTASSTIATTLMRVDRPRRQTCSHCANTTTTRSEEHTSELQSRF